MSPAGPASLVIASRHRPALLRRCLRAVSQMDHPNFEVIVVADPGGLAVAREFPVKTVAYDEANLSAARNLGIRAAAGDIVAFIDDDAVPEPLWLSRLCAVFSDSHVAAAGGFVVGRNGISYQWKAGTIDDRLRTGPLSVQEDRVNLHVSKPGLAVEIKGVNCAYRRSVIMELGGFDPEIHYYLDESELNLRLATLGATVAIVPDARVHHAKAASAQRRADQVPTSLRVIGASMAITLRRHGARESDLQQAHAQLVGHERAKLARLLRGHRLTSDQSEQLIASLNEGFAEGCGRTLAALCPILSEPPPFLRWPAGRRTLTTLHGWFFNSARLRAEAVRRVAEGEVVRIFLFTPTALYHHVRFESHGYWVQSGGIFGKSLRSDPVFRPWRLKSRLEREIRRLGTGFGNS